MFPPRLPYLHEFYYVDLPSIPWRGYTKQPKQNLKISPRMIVGVIVFLLFTPLVLLISSGQLDWWTAWVYSTFSVVLSLGSRVLMARRHPELVAERARYRQAEGVNPWHKKLVPLVSPGRAIHHAGCGWTR